MGRQDVLAFCLEYLFQVFSGGDMPFWKCGLLFIWILVPGLVVGRHHLGHLLLRTLKQWTITGIRELATCGLSDSMCFFLNKCHYCCSLTLSGLAIVHKDDELRQ